MDKAIESDFPTEWFPYTSVYGIRYEIEINEFAEYNYGFEGAFSNLVELLGGTYECDDWKAKWTIGQDTWTATLETQKTDDHDGVVKWLAEQIL